MSYRTNRRTGGVFRTRDYTPSEIESQTRRFTCPRCEAVLGQDIPPATAQMYSRETGHEVPGTPVASFISRAELNEHIRMMHPGERFPTRSHRRLGSGLPQETGGTTINITQTNTTPKTRRRRSRPATETATFTEPETASEPETATATEGETEESGEGFTDDDGQVFDGQGGLLDEGGESETEPETRGGLL